jgi:hypothetical protein
MNSTGKICAVPAPNCSLTNRPTLLFICQARPVDVFNDSLVHSPNIVSQLHVYLNFLHISGAI